jgi:glycosyltransferase involved in cell wall biosynthesis
MNIQRIIGISNDYYQSKIKDVGRRCLRVIGDLKVVSMEPVGTPRGRLLLSYQLEPFVADSAAADPRHQVTWHSHNWETGEIAKSFLEMGYGVDAVAWLNRAFVPRRSYDVVIDIRYNLQQWSSILGPKCLKIFHIDTCHTLFRNASEARHLLDLQQRRGISLEVRRFECPNLGIEHCDCATVIGNEHTMATYAYAHKPMFPVGVSSMVSMEWQADKDFDGVRNNFLWLGSTGMVTKGLDLVLEAFAGLPDYHLAVCGPVEEEYDFARAYRRELHETPNIHLEGWTDVRSERFAGLARHSIGLVFPSCSEGQAGSVINCMSAGLIPILSRQSGVDVDDFGFLLRDCTVDEIRAAVITLSSLSADRLRCMSRAAWKRTVENHSREAWTLNYRRVAREILSMHARGEFQPAAADPGLAVNPQFQTVI